MTNLDSIFKSRDITLPAKVHIVKAVVFPIVMYRCESWIIKKAEHQRIDAFELWCWRRLLPHGLEPTRPLHPWDFPGKSTGVGCHCLLRQMVTAAMKLKDAYSLEGKL